MAFLNRLRRNATSAADRFPMRQRRPRHERPSPPVSVGRCTISPSPGQAPGGTGRGTGTLARGDGCRPHGGTGQGCPWRRCSRRSECAGPGKRQGVQTQGLSRGAGGSPHADEPAESSSPDAQSVPDARGYKHLLCAPRGLPRARPCQLRFIRRLFKIDG